MRLDRTGLRSPTLSPPKTLCPVASKGSTFGQASSTADAPSSKPSSLCVSCNISSVGLSEIILTKWEKSHSHAPNSNSSSLSSGSSPAFKAIGLGAPPCPTGPHQTTHDCLDLHVSLSRPLSSLPRCLEALTLPCLLIT